MATHDLTEDEEHWIGVALENCITSARVLAESEDLDDQLDAGLLLNRYLPLAEKFPAPEIGEKG